MRYDRCKVCHEYIDPVESQEEICLLCSAIEDQAKV